jgi:hypothetical protein
LKNLSRFRQSEPARAADFSVVRSQNWNRNSMELWTTVSRRHVSRDCRSALRISQCSRGLAWKLWKSFRDRMFEISSWSWSLSRGFRREDDRAKNLASNQRSMLLVASNSGDGDLPNVRLKSPLPGETASLRLPDYTVCLCRGCREYGLRDSTSHNHELTAADAPHSVGLHGQAIHAGNFPPSVPRGAVLPR